MIAFHAQQAAEKLLKGFLTLYQVEFPKTHDINELLNLVSTADAIFAESLRGAHVLTKYGIDIRWPGDQPDVSADEAKEPSKRRQMPGARFSPGWSRTFVVTRECSVSPSAG